MTTCLQSVLPIALLLLASSLPAQDTPTPTQPAAAQ